MEVSIWQKERKLYVSVGNCWVQPPTPAVAAPKFALPAREKLDTMWHPLECMYPMPNKISSIEYICTWCGAKIIRGATSGRPSPGNCPRKPKDRDGKMKPHTWRINRKI